MLWKRGSATVWEAIEDGKIRREYTTVMTTLDRLYKKRLLDRTMEQNSRAFRYLPRHCSQVHWQREFMVETMKQVLDMETTASPLSYVVDALSEHDPGLLDDLQRLVNEKLRNFRKTRPSHDTR